MKVLIRPSILTGNIIAPPSKSYSHRAIILASLARGKSVIRDFLLSDDIKTTIKACILLGTVIKWNGNAIEVEGTGGNFPVKNSLISIDCSQSGTTMRLMTAVAALSNTKVTLTGEKRLLKRPIGELVKVLKILGKDIIAKDNNQLPPVTTLGGVFEGGKVTLLGSISSQFISALLLIAPFGIKDTVLFVKNLKSEPYVDITMDLMKTFGVNVEKKGNTFHVKCGQTYNAINYEVEGDFSSASYFFAANAVTGSNISVNNLNNQSVQGDRYIIEIIKQMKEKCLNTFEIDMGNYPDIVPTIAIVAAAMKGLTMISNIDHLRTKESDRIKSIEDGLQRMGIKTKSKKECLTIVGGTLHGAEIDTYNDHRIAMSFAVAGLCAKGNTVINDAQVVNKSYPDFWNDLKKLGADIKIIN